MKTKTATPTLTKNIVQFRSKFVNLPNAGENNRQMAVSVLSELLQFGYVLSNDAIENIASASRADIISFHNEVLDYLKYLTGAGRTYRAFWPGFPTQVMEMDECERWTNQILHYWANGAYLPDEWTKSKSTAFEQPKYYEIKLGSDEKFEGIFTTLVSVNQSLTPEDLNIVKYFVESGVALKFPDIIPFKENLCVVLAELSKKEVEFFD